MRYECTNCQKIFNESRIIMLTNGSGFGGSWIEPWCEDCIKKEYPDKLKGV